MNHSNTASNSERGSLAHATQSVRAKQSGQRATWRERFHHFAHAIASAVGSPWAFIIAAVVVIAWAATGPLFGYSDTWQLVINTTTTIVTFLMVFLIQNTQNRDAKAIHLKLDELIRAKKGARNTLVDLEDVSEEELARIEKEFRRLHERAANGQKAKQEISRRA
jgi:low affinity Fe/Cu permease